MVTVTLELDADDERLVDFARVTSELPQEWIIQGADIYESQMQLEVPISSGRLQSSIFSTVFKEYAEISTNTGYGKAVDEGRKGFKVVAKRARALRFFINGRIVFVKSAHPGPARANRFIKRTLVNASPRIIAMINTVFQEKLANT